MSRKRFLLAMMLCMTAMGLWAQGHTRVKNYFVGMDVHEDNSFSVYEEVLAHFAEERHGFYRYLPYKYWLRESDKDYLCDIEEVAVEGDVADLSNKDNNLLIRIGDPDRTVKGDKLYSIEYVLRNSDDRIEEKDWFYHSIVGKDLELDIDTLSFTIVFDKPLPKNAAEQLKVVSGEIGSQTNDLGVEYWMSGDTIFGYVCNVPQCHPVSVILPLPEGYFVGEKGADPKLAYLFLGISAVLILLLLCYELTNRQPLVVKQIEFYPPDGMCSAELGTFIDDRVDNIDLASLIPWYASQGYVKLEEKEEKKLLGTKTYLEMTKLKECPNDWKQYQRTFFGALFSESGSTVRLDKLPKVEKMVEAAKKELEQEFEGERKLTTWHKSVWLFIPLLICSTIGLIAAMPYDFMANDDWIGVGFIWATPAVIGAIRVIIGATSKSIDSKWMRKGRVVLRFVAMLGVMSLHYWMFEQQISRPVFVAFYIACFVVVELMERLNTDTEYRLQTLGKLVGLKEFIETAEEPRLRELIAEDSAYFYRLLPYAMVFNVSNAWAKHFENIEMERPDWYNASSTAASTGYINNLVSNVSSAADSAISCMAPSSSGSGGSGGGTGGGGGGAW